MAKARYKSNFLNAKVHSSTTTNVLDDPVRKCRKRATLCKSAFVSHAIASGCKTERATMIILLVHVSFIFLSIFFTKVHEKKGNLVLVGPLSAHTKRKTNFLHPPFSNCIASMCVTFPCIGMWQCYECAIVRMLLSSRLLLDTLGHTLTH